MNFIKKHKTLSIIIAVLVLLFIISFIIIYKMFFGYGNDKYGSRLKKIENIKISNEQVEKMTSELSELDLVDKVTCTINGKLINVIFKVDPTLDKTDAKNYGWKVLDYLDEEEINNYDIQVFVVSKNKDEEYNGFPIIGYKKSTNEGMTWSNN